MNYQSLRLRLMLGFVLLTLLGWSAASLGSWWQTRQKINELFDTQQMLFAKRLVTMNPEQLSSAPLTLPETKKLLRHHRGAQEDDALAFAVFTRDGKMVMNDGDNGKDFLFDYVHNGFTDGKLKDDDDLWRMVWLSTPDEKYVIAVGQEWEYRDDMTRDIVQTNLIPWLAALPLMLIFLLWLLTHELAPLKRITQQLRTRSPDDGTPLAARRLPQEVRPLVDELNALFARIGNMLNRERRFTSDAAHELRSPLAALKVQTEVAQLAHDDEAMRNRALRNLDAGIERATRLVDQLLTLSRLDVETAPKMQPVNLQQLLQQSVMDHYGDARTAGINIILHSSGEAVIKRGHPLLLTLMVRNLVDNAIRYSQPGDEVQLRLGQQHFQVIDTGPGVNSEALEHIGERFYRPPGQQASGSGLGLSIVNHIAQLHGMKVNLSNRPEGGFLVTVSW